MDNKRDAKNWLKQALNRSRPELVELVEQEKGRRSPSEPDGGGRRTIETADISEELADAADTETPYVEDVDADLKLLDDIDEEIDDEDQETGEGMACLGKSC